MSRRQESPVDGGTVDPDALEDSLRILSRYTGTATDACFHILGSWALSEDEDIVDRRLRERVYLARYARQPLFGVDWGEVDVLEFRRLYELTVDLVSRENELMGVAERF